jgi:hypothetical protein
MAAASGVDRRLFAVLPEDTRLVAEAAAAGIDKVVLTSSAETGQAVLAALAPHIVPSVMELSGHDAVFVCDGADLATAARCVAYGLTFNGGATCIAPRRVFVERRQVAAFEAKLVEALAERAFHTGGCNSDGHRPSHSLSPGGIEGTPRPRSAHSCMGAHNLLGMPNGSGRTGESYVGVPDKRISVATSTPFLSIIPVRDVDHALALSKDCPFRLGATVFGPATVAAEVAARVEAGCVVVNDMIAPTADPRLPFGGRGRSGFGVTRGAEGLLEMTRVKAIVTRRGSFRPHLDPPHPLDTELFRHYAAAAHGATLARRIRGAAACLSTLLRRSKS